MGYRFGVANASCDHDLIIAARSIALAKPTPKTKNAAAVALGRLGGQKGGPARAKKLSAKRRSEIAKAAAAARWGSSE
jgi:hypothetical protein